MKNIFLMVIFIWPLIIFASDTEVTWIGFGGVTSMTGQNAGDKAGFSVAISIDGSILAVGEVGWDGVGGDSGRVRTYRLQNGVWTEFGGATSMTGNGNFNDQAGRFIAMSYDGAIIAVGEPGWNGVGFSSGRVRTYSLQNGIWTEFGGATSMTGPVAIDQAGFSVAINSDGSIVAVGEIGWDGAGMDSGRVRTYSLQGGVWTEFGGETSMAGENAGDQVGRSVDMNSDGTIIAVGEPFWDGVGISSGRVRTYRLQGGVWTEFGGATSMTGENAGDQAGFSITMNPDGTIIAVGENGWNGSRGRVRTYVLQGGVWTQTGGATSMTGQFAGDQAGNSVAINSDGSIIAVGEIGWSGNTGRVRSYSYSLESGIWVEFGGATSMTGENASDQAGRSVAMNYGGSLVVVGEDGWNGSRGRVRTYFYPSYNDNETEARIRNSELAHVCYSDISQGTYTDHQTTPGGVGQGAWFTPYRITVQGR